LSLTVAAGEFRLSKRRPTAFTRYFEDGEMPSDNNWVEKQIRPIAIGRSNGCLLVTKRQACHLMATAQCATSANADHGLRGRSRRRPATNSIPMPAVMRQLSMALSYSP
jgi:hypothetical protein